MASAIDSADELELIDRLFNQEAIERGPCFKCGTAAVEVWLLQIGPVVFGAKRVAVAAVIAIVGEIGDLIRLLQHELELLAGWGHAAIRSNLDVAILQL